MIKNKLNMIDKGFESLNNNGEMALNLLEVMNKGNCLDEIKSLVESCLGFKLEIHEIYKVNNGNSMFISAGNVVFEMFFCESAGWNYKILNGFADYRNSFRGEYKNRRPTMAELVDSQNF